MRKMCLACSLAALTWLLPETVEAHHCDLIGWNSDGTQAALWCLQGCSTESCVGFENIQAQSAQKIERSWIIQPADPPPEPPLLPDNPWLMERKRKLQNALEELRQQGFRLTNLSADVFRPPRFNPDTADQFSVLPFEKATRTSDQKFRCGPEPQAREVFTRFFISHSQPNALNQSWEGSLNLSLRSCTQGANQQVKMTFIMLYEPADHGYQTTVTDSLEFELSPLYFSSGASGEFELEFAYSPQKNALILRHSFSPGPSSRYSSEKIVDLRPLSDIILRTHQTPQKPQAPSQDFKPAYYQGDLRSDLAEYFGMVDAAATPTVLVGGVSPFRAYGTFSVLSNGGFFHVNRWVDVGINAELLSMRFLEEDDAFALLSGGPSFRLGRLVVNSKLHLISFRNEDDWFPGFTTSATFPLLTDREIGLWSLLVPMPVVGLDIWFNSQLEHDQTQFWFGFSWIGTVSY